MSVVDFIRNFHDLKRLEEILLVFMEQGFGVLINKIKLNKHVPLHKRLISKKCQNPDAVRLRKSFEKLGPTFIKFGQLLSLRPDLVPYDYVLEFEKMQDKVPVFPYSQVKSIVEKELGISLSKYFKSFDTAPIASASVSQVHRAVLKNGKKVAVKVKRPDVDNLMKTDIRIMHHLANLLDSRVGDLKQYKLPKIVEEFERWTNKELDFNIEASNAKRFRSNFRNSKDIVIPAIYKSTKNMIVMDYLDGIPLHDFSKIKKKYKDTHRILSKGYSAIVKQVFEHGFYHADPHPGNILVLNSGKLGFLDFGIIGTFDEKLKLISAEIFYGILDNDIDRVAGAFMRFGVSKNIDEFEFKQQLQDLFDPLLYSKAEDVEVSLILEHAISLASRYNIHVPRDYVLFGKALVTLEGLSIKYDPGYNFIRMTKPVLRTIMLKKYSPENIKKTVKKNALAYSELLSDIPEKAGRFLDTISKGAIAVDIEDKDVGTLSKEMEKSAGNIALGFIVAALIVGSALIWQIETQPLIYSGWPVIPLAGLCVAALLGLWVVHRTIFVRLLR